MFSKMLIGLLIIVTLQLFYSESASVVTAGLPGTCNTTDGQVGECVQNYLCDRHTNTVVEDGSNVIDVRFNKDDTTCPLPMVCCKVAGNDTRRDGFHPSQAGNQSSQLVIDNFSPPIACTTSDGNPGECVPSNLAKLLSDTVVDDGSYILDSRTGISDSCPYPLTCLQITNDKEDDRDDTPREKPNFFSYVRMARSSDRQGCGWRNENGIQVNSNVSLTDDHARPGEFPWVVSIMRLESAKDKNVLFEYLGDGSLIHHRAVLTAAHVFEGISNDTNLYVVVGDFYQRTESVLPTKVIRVEKVQIHEGYMKDVLINNYALVFLVKPAVVASHVNFVCLPPKSVEMATGSKCISSGWGKNGLDEHQYIMNKVELPLVDRESCQTQLRPLEMMGPYFILDDSFMCALGEASVDSCKGSGGSPLVCPMLHGRYHPGYFRRSRRRAQDCPRQELSARPIAYRTAFRLLRKGCLGFSLAGPSVAFSSRTELQERAAVTETIGDWHI
ncbi:unnamed protein product [Chilo suppressalis]|uniref:Peptidase S1 domain-containing protein n=1 Tax=Chilo suppressalis TaxID=168631 RepID=A0ABN8L9S6_CHISP|nr:unnamed protein product [Chilo suppressalis]